MITLQANSFDISHIKAELDLKVAGIQELKSQVVLREFANAVFTVGAKAFIKALNIEAKTNPKKYHHLYEWNAAGNNTKRLFFLYNESNSNGVLVIRPGFIQSTSRVPVDPKLLLPGKTGKSIAGRSVFRDKATVMEKGDPITYRTSKPTPMFDGEKINFVARGTLIRISHPGGTQVKGSFESFFHTWYAKKLQAIINASGIIGSIDREAAAILNKAGAGAPEVRKAVIAVLRQYSMGEEVI